MVLFILTCVCNHKILKIELHNIRAATKNIL